ncbi:hypothetical protein FD14_GL001152 [Secundilactobacillus similis DSM 23365 = JCM 2765]|uniref:Uncharacterized protein n=1 Tax=Secundilactobacillus similis DSM 23365 = JCM 2765 TaxID=1423804 RepID=A0A0R2F4P7_9LACO|nr:hypothetical protein FD14_GL001152 [Secundilactobacillus similis DSM 23365 = JCM 2765]
MKAPGPGGFTDVALHTALNPSRSAHLRWTQASATKRWLNLTGSDKYHPSI